MSSRSRSLAAGVLGGFFGAANSRRNKVEARMQSLADNKALQDTERARSEYESVKKSSQLEKATTAKMISSGNIVKDPKSGAFTFTSKYWKEKAFSSSGEANREAFELTDIAEEGGVGKMTALAMRGQDNTYHLNYHPASVYEEQFTQRQDDINKQQAEAGSQRAQPSALGQMLTGGSPEEEAEKMANAGKGAEFTSVGGPSRSPSDFNSSEDVVFSKEEENTDPTAVTQVNLYGKGAGGSMKEGNFSYDPLTNRVLNPESNQWEPVPSNVGTLPSDRPFVEMKVTDDKGVELTKKFIQTYPGDKTPGVIHEANRSYVPLSSSRTRDVIDDSNKKPALAKLHVTNLENYSRTTKVSSLASNLLQKDYTGNMFSYVGDMLSTISDSIGANVGLTGDKAKDINALVEFVRNDLVETPEVLDALGILDTQAAQRGDVEVATGLLKFATARMIYGSGRLIVDAVKQADVIVGSIVSGTTSHNASLVSLININDKEIKRIIKEDLTIAEQDMEHPIWENYPGVKQNMKEYNITPVYSVTQGTGVTSKLKDLEKKDPDAYKKSISSLERTPFNTLKRVEETSVYYDMKRDEPIMLYYKLNEDKSYSFWALPVKGSIRK